MFGEYASWTQAANCPAPVAYPTKVGSSLAPLATRNPEESIHHLCSQSEYHLLSFALSLSQPARCRCGGKTWVAEHDESGDPARADVTEGVHSRDRRVAQSVIIMGQTNGKLRTSTVCPLNGSSMRCSFPVPHGILLAGPPEDAGTVSQISEVLSPGFGKGTGSGAPPF